MISKSKVYQRTVQFGGYISTNFFIYIAHSLNNERGKHNFQRIALNSFNAFEYESPETNILAKILYGKYANEKFTFNCNANYSPSGTFNCKKTLQINTLVLLWIMT